MNDLVERLRALIPMDDHDRGCEGRNYTCQCGYDDRMEDGITEAADRITELEADLTRYAESLHYMREAADRQRAFEQSAHVDGVRAGIDAAAKAILVAQYDPAPYTKASYAIRALDPEAIVRAGIKVTPAP